VEPNNLKGTKLGLTGSSGLLRGCSGLLIHRSGCSHVCSGLEVEMEFGEVKIGVRVYWHQLNPTTNLVKGFDDAIQG
jgi:hypothetical protein